MKKKNIIVIGTLTAAVIAAVTGGIIAHVAKNK